MPQEKYDAMVFILKGLLTDLGMTRPIGEASQQKNFRNAVFYSLDFAIEKTDSGLEELRKAFSEYKDSYIDIDSGKRRYSSKKEPNSPLLQDLQSRKLDLHGHRGLASSEQAFYADQLTEMKKIETSGIIDIEVIGNNELCQYAKEYLKVMTSTYAQKSKMYRRLDLDQATEFRHPGSRSRFHTPTTGSSTSSSTSSSSSSSSPDSFSESSTSLTRREPKS